MKRIYLHLAALLLLAMITSCAKDWNDTTSDDKQEGSSQIILRIQAPGGFSSAATRGLTLAQEGAIENIWVLAFNNTGTLVDIRKGENISSAPTPGDTNIRSFTVKLKRSADANDTYSLVTLANCDDILNNTIGTDIEAVAGDLSYAGITARLRNGINSKMYANGGSIPMWGETQPIVLEKNGSAINLKIMRAIARVDVGIGARVFANNAYSWSGKNDKGETIPFEMTDVYIISPNNAYAAVPLPGNLDVDKSKATKPTVPAGTQAFTLTESQDKFRFTDANGEITRSGGTDASNTWGSYTTQSIYIPEADVKMGENARSGDANHENRMAVVIGGKYGNTQKVTYYRIDFARDGNIMDVLRNHLYQFNIKKVSGEGYNDVETAYRSMATNMTVEVLNWNDADISDVVFDGQYYFSITSRKVEFTPMGNETETVTIKTNAKNLEFWEEREGSEFMEIDLGGTTSFKNEEMGYQYTLSTVNTGAVYSLKVEATKHNVSNVVSNRLDKWRIKANRLNAKFEVDQQYTVLYVSYINGQSQNLYPEGTLANTIPIEIMALKPVEIKAEENGQTATWIKLGDVSGLSNGNAGLYQARLKVEVDPFAYTQGVATIRTGYITVTPQGETPRVFTINQESPVFKFAKDSETVTRRSGTTYHTYVDIITNLPDTDFNIIKKDSVGVQAVRIKHKGAFYNVDRTNPRSRRFDVDVDMASNLPMQKDAFEKSFTATVDQKYGTIPLPIIRVDVLEGDNHFDWFWKNAIIPPASMPFNFNDDNNSAQYFFPWQTTSATIHFNSNNGLEYYSAHANNKPLNGRLDKGEDIIKDDYMITPYTFTFNKANNNIADQYDLYFKSTTSPTQFVKNLKMGLGVQMWKRMPANADILLTHRGKPETDPYTLKVTSNVEWEATVAAGDGSFIKMRPNSSATWTTLPMSTDDRVQAPQIVASSYNAETNLVNINDVGIAIPPYNELNSSNKSRTVTVAFSNKSFASGGSAGGIALTNSVITVTQYSPTLTYNSGAPIGDIPYYENNYTIHANTNLKSWGVRVYVGDDNSGTKILEQTVNPNFSELGSSNSSATIKVPRYNATQDRRLSFYLFHTTEGVSTKEVKIITVTQNWEDYVVFNGLKWKRGNLISSGTNSCTIGSPNDAGLYFKYGSLVGWRGGAAGDGTGIGTPSLGVTTAPNSYYTTNWSSVPYHNGGEFIYDSSRALGDPCQYYLGVGWRTPSRSDYSKITSGPWREHLGTYGYLISRSGALIIMENSIFMPAGGRINGGSWDYLGNGAYLTSEKHPSESLNNYALWFHQTRLPEMNSWMRSAAYPVRCVSQQ